jgi:hypothetical protein
MRAEAEQIVTPSLRFWALLLIDRFGRDGTLPPNIDRSWLARHTRIGYRTCSRYLAELERLGLIERRHTGRITRDGTYRHVSIITAASRFTADQAQKSQMPTKRAGEQRKGHSFDTPTPPIRVTSSGSVGSSLPVAGASQDQEPVSDDDRRTLDEQWPKMARSRSDLPGQRPGYGTNATREREEFDRWYAQQPEPAVSASAEDDDDRPLRGAELARALLTARLREINERPRP